MSLKGRRFSLDNSALRVVREENPGQTPSRSVMELKTSQTCSNCSLDRLVDPSLGGKRGSSRTAGKKSRHSVDNGQEPNSSASLSKETIAEEQAEGLHQKSSLRKHNKSFHKLFAEIPEEETLTHTCSCSLHREVLYHGRLFISENYLCFYSSVLLKDTKVTIATASVTQVKKHYLSMVSVQTADGEKYTFVSLRQREFTYELMQSRCLNTQGESANSSPHLSSAENEPDPELASGSSSMEDGFGHAGSRQSSVQLEESFSRLSAESKEEGPTIQSADAQGLLAETGAPSGIWGLVGRLSLFLLDLQDFGLFFYFNILLVVLLLLVSGLIGLRIMALHERLESLGALAELHLHQ